MNNIFRLVSAGFLTIIFALFCLEGTRWILGGNIFEEGMVSRWLFVSITLLVAFVLQSKKNLLILAILISITSVVYFITSSTFAAWILLVLIFVTLIWVAHLLTSGRSIMVRILIYILIALFTGVVILAAEQLQTRFSEEEFFVALQVLLIAFTWGVLALSVSLWKRLANIHIDIEPKVDLKKYLIIF